MSVIHSLPVLYSLSRTGKTKRWQIKARVTDDGVILVTTHGYTDGKQTITPSSPILGKNIGRSNETTPEEQAISEANSKHQKQLDRNYSETIPTSVDDFLNIKPMLAHSYDKRKHDIVFPAYEQPKLNGVRCLAVKQSDGTYKLMSRGGKEYTVLPHIALVLEELRLPFDAPLDGELFHTDMDFETISGSVKKAKETSWDLQYWIYDIADTTLTFEKRLELMENMRESLAPYLQLVLVPTSLVADEDALMLKHASNSTKYEGTMIRNAAGMYVFDYRSADLQKLKDFLDAEFEIIGGEEASGNDEGTVVFRCKTEDGKEFSVRPVGKELLDDLPNLIGHHLTVKFQNYSSDGIPIFPVGITIRNYE
jgi:DNA ligase-1